MIYCLLYFIILIYWLLLCCVKVKRWKERKKRCTLRIQAQVVEVITTESRRGTAVLHKPILKVSLGGSEHIIKSAVIIRSLKFNLGEEIWIYVNPNSPQDFMYDSPHKDRIIFSEAGSCLVVLPVLLMWAYLLFFK